MRHRSWGTLQTTLMKVRIQWPHGNKSAKLMLQQNNWDAEKLKVSGDFRKIPKFPSLQRQQGYTMSLMKSICWRAEVLGWKISISTGNKSQSIFKRGSCYVFNSSVTVLHTHTEKEVRAYLFCFILFRVMNSIWEVFKWNVTNLIWLLKGARSPMRNKKCFRWTALLVAQFTFHWTRFPVRILFSSITTRHIKGYPFSVHTVIFSNMPLFHSNVLPDSECCLQPSKRWLSKTVRRRWSYSPVQWSESKSEVN